MIAGVTIDRDRLRRTTALHLLCERARSTPDSVAFRSKHLGIYRERSWCDYARLCGALCARTAEYRVGTRRTRRHHGRRLRGMVDLRSRRPVARRHRLRHLSDRLGDGGRIPDARRRRRRSSSPRTRNTSTRSCRFADRLPALRRIVVIDDTAMFGYDARQARSLARAAARRGRRSRSRVAGDAGRKAVSRRSRPSSSTRPAPPAIPRVRWSPTASISPPRDRWSTQYPTLTREAAPHGRLSAALPRARPRRRGHAAADLAARAAFRRRRRGSRRPRCSRWRRRCCSPCRAICRSSPRRCSSACSTPAGLKRVRLRVRDARCARSCHAALGRRRRPAAQRRALCALWHAAVFRPILNKLGFDKLELVVRGGAPSAGRDRWRCGTCSASTSSRCTARPKTAGGIIAGQRGPFPRPGDVGTVPEGFEVKLAEDGEILVRSPDLFDGYWSNEEATRAVLGADGWMRTGDVGEWRTAACG